MTNWIVLLKTGLSESQFYGPFDDEVTAAEFAAYLTSEVDPAEVVKMHSPTRELIAYWRSILKEGRPAADWRPEFWPPKPGHVWQDRNGDRWIGTPLGQQSGGYLICLSQQADDNAEEVWARFGPMTFVKFVEVTESEVPF